MYHVIRARRVVVTTAVLLVLLSYTVAANGAGAATAEVQEDPATRVLNDAAALEGLLNDYWTQELAGLYELSFDTPDRFEWYQGSNNALCGGGYENGAENAYYCPVDSDEYVAFDLDWFTSYLERFPGDAITFLVLAHEWGHAVQDTWQEQQPGVDTWSPAYQKELNADCLAGVFLADSVMAEAIILEDGDAEAIATWFFENGSGQWFDPGTHGTREERAQAFADGLVQDADYCRVTY
ncbi:neutral zinc metallopeptidase [Geodermatophilus maliterrae]|uniref:Neutral zinc metallopeptidase n=1 Tax=Geodermatophilus maliterrae TaxID=3162531 RepID=A0ABV3XD28_9ACTN